MEYATFSRHLNDSFTTLQNGAPLELRLVECVELPVQPGLARTPFSLIFVGSADRPLTQQIHALSHPATGELGVFLVPIGPGHGGLQYQAVFS